MEIEPREEKVMATKNIKADNWDGKSRPSNDTYRKNFNDIFGEKEINELKESQKNGSLNKKERTKNERL